MKLTENEVKLLSKIRNQLSNVCNMLDREVYYNNAGEARTTKDMIKKIDIVIATAIVSLDNTICLKPEEI